MTRKLIILSLLFFNVYSYACSCTKPSFKEAIEWADEIFIARLIEIKEMYPLSLSYIKFEVIKKWKGSSKKYIKIYPDLGCSPNFNMFGSRYLIYAKNKKFIGPFSKLTTSACTRTISEFDYDEIKNDKSLLNKAFTKHVKLRFIHLELLPTLYTLFIFSIGLFIGYHFKRRKSNNL